jgi:prepilin peptidase CpaA
MTVRLELFYWLLFGGGLLLACLLDLFSRRIPNWLTVAVLMTGLLARGLHAGPLASAWGLLGALMGGAVLIYPFKRGWLAGGDVKLLIAVGGWLGPRWLPEAALVMTFSGGIIALFYLLRAPRDERRGMLTNLKLSAMSMTIVADEGRSHRLSPPYALAIAAGAAWTVCAHAAVFLQR